MVEAPALAKSREMFPVDMGGDAFRDVYSRELMLEWSRRQPFWAMRCGIPVVVVSRLEDVKTVFFDPARFTVEAPSVPGMEDVDQFGGLENVLQLDGARHMRVRTLMNPAFAPKAMKALETAVLDIVTTKLDRIGATGAAFDLMTDFSADLIRRVLLGATLQLSEAHQDIFKRMHDNLSLVGDMRPGEPWPQPFVDSIVEVRAAVREIVEERRGKPGTDFISNLVNTKIDGDALSDDEVFGNINAICAGALGSTSGLVGMTTYFLCTHAEQLDLFKSDIDKYVDGAFEEGLRYQGAGVTAFNRFATADTQVGETFIPKDTPVLIAMLAANFDEVQFPDPLKFDIRRNNRLMQSFGGGIHHCIGNRLARMVMRTAIKGLFERFPDLHLADAEFQPRFIGLPGELYPASIPMLAW